MKLYNVQLTVAFDDECRTWEVRGKRFTDRVCEVEMVLDGKSAGKLVLTLDPPFEVEDQPPTVTLAGALPPAGTAIN